jgi:hypothetical protein
MSTCDSEFVQPKDPDEPPVVCPGHLGKFGSCVDEALYEWNSDEPHNTTGDTDFEGHLGLVILPVFEIYGLGRTDGPDEREVIIPAGNYLVWTASSGAVTVTTVDTEQGAWDIFEVTQARYALWEAGCDPDDPAGHADCSDSCDKPEWVNA